MTEQITFVSMIILSMTISRTPLRYPFQWMETFFHELSHGLAALITLGKIHKIELKFNGAGCCWTSGGLRIPILLAGYLGAATWGALIYIAGWSLGEAGDVRLLEFLMGILIIVTIFWVRNPTTFLIMATMFIVLALPTQIQDTTFTAYVIEFFGLYVLKNAIFAPLDLIDGKDVGDGAELRKCTLLIPEGVWILLWFFYGLGALYFVWDLTMPEIIIPVTTPKGGISIS